MSLLVNYDGVLAATAAALKTSPGATEACHCPNPTGASSAPDTWPVCRLQSVTHALCRRTAGEPLPPANRAGVKGLSLSGRETVFKLEPPRGLFRAAGGTARFFQQRPPSLQPRSPSPSPPPPVPPAQAPRQPSPARRVLFFPGGGGFRVRKALGDPPVVSCPHRAVRFLRLENPQDRLAAKALLSLTSGKPALVVITQKDSRLSGAGVALCLLWLANFLENYMQCCVVVSNFRGS